MKTKSISKTCKLFKDCPFSWDCLYEIAFSGSAIWSVELCYDLKHLMDCGLVSGPPQPETKIAMGMHFLINQMGDGKNIC